MLGRFSISISNLIPHDTVVMGVVVICGMLSDISIVFIFV